MSFVFQKKRILKDTMSYSLSNFFVQGIGTVTSVLVRRGLGPFYAGMWEFLKLILNYGLCLDLGVSAVAYRDIPFAIGQSRPDKAEELKNICFSYSIGVAVVLAAGLVVWSVFDRGRSPFELRIGMLALAVILILTSIYNMLVNLLRSYNNFTVLSKVLVMNSAVTLVLVAALVPMFKIYGMYLTTIVTSIVCCLYVYVNTGYRFRFTVDIRKLTDILRTSIPMFTAGMGYVLLMSVDKIVIAKYIGFENVGFYTIATLAMTGLETLPKSFGIVVFPRMQEHYGQMQSAESLEGYLIRPIRLIAYFMPVFIGIAYFLVPLLVHYVLPKFIPGIPCFKILMAGIFFLCAAYPASLVMFTLNKQWKLTVLTGIAVLFALVLSLISVKSGFGIIGVAVSMDAAYFFYFLLLIISCLPMVVAPKHVKALVLEVLLMFLYSFCLVTVLDMFRFSGIFILDVMLHITAFLAGISIPIFFAKIRSSI